MATVNEEVQDVVLDEMLLFHPPGPAPAVIKKYTSSGKEKLDAQTVRQVTQPSGLENLVWDDTHINNIQIHCRPKMEAGTIIQLGENMVIMLVLGPVVKLAEIVSYLALHLKTPSFDDMFPQGMFSTTSYHGVFQNIGTELLTEVDDRTQRGSLSVDTNTLTHVEETGGRVQQITAVARIAAFTTARGEVTATGGSTQAVLDLLDNIRRLEDYEQVAFYSFVAAITCRMCVKGPASVKKHLTDCVHKFIGFYDDCEIGVTFPEPKIESLTNLITALRPGGKYIGGVIKAFLLRRYYFAGITVDESGLLDYVLLLHTSYNGMHLISLSMGAAHAIGDQNLTSAMNQFRNTQTEPGLLNIIDYFDEYATDGPSTPGLLAPWSRILDNRYWSSLSVKGHPVLGALLMAACHGENPRIFEMMANKASSEMKRRALEMMSAFRQARASDLIMDGAHAGTIMAKFGGAITTVEDMDTTPAEGEPTGTPDRWL